MTPQRFCKRRRGRDRARGEEMAGGGVGLLCLREWFAQERDSGAAPRPLGSVPL